MWNDAAIALRYTDPRRLARLMALAWRSAAEYGDEALLSNLQMNMLDCFGVTSALDWANVPAPGDALHFLVHEQG